MKRLSRRLKVLFGLVAAKTAGTLWKAARRQRWALWRRVRGVWHWLNEGSMSFRQCMRTPARREAHLSQAGQIVSILVILVYFLVLGHLLDWILAAAGGG